MDIPEISKVNVKPDDVLVLKIPLDIYPVDVASSLLKSLGKCFPENVCMFLPSDCDIQIYGQTDTNFIPATSEELRDFLSIKVQA